MTTFHEAVEKLEAIVVSRRRRPSTSGGVPMTMFHKDVLKLDLEEKAQELAGKLETTVLKTLKRRGLVVAVSGGIDSACVAALAVRALGPKRVALVLGAEGPGMRSNVRDHCDSLARLAISASTESLNVSNAAAVALYAASRA